jgi:hypothetical protein
VARELAEPIHRTTPLLLGLFSLVTLWACQLTAQSGRLPVLGAAWYKNPDPQHLSVSAQVVDDLTWGMMKARS